MVGILLSVWVRPNPLWFLVLKILSVLFFLATLICIRWPTCLGFMFFLFLTCLCWLRAWEGHPVVNPVHFSHVLDDRVLIGFVADEPRINERNARFRLQ